MSTGRRHLRLLGIAVALGAVATAGLAAYGTGPLEQALASIRADHIRAHVWFLSLDALRGRAPGTPGGRLAADYVESQFRRAGLLPLGGDDYRQSVPLLGVRPDSGRVRLTFITGAGRDTARYPEDVVVWSGRPDTSTTVSGRVVFVGYGVDAPEYDWDDYGDRDLEGAILMVLVNDPPAPPEEPRFFEGRSMTYYGRWTYKLEEARRRGAAGVLIVHTALSAGYPWPVVVSSWTGEHVRLDVRDRAAPRIEGWITAAYASSLLEEAGLDFDELVVRAARRDFRPIDTGIRLEARMASTIRRIPSDNVVGIVPGSDPSLSRETVVYTAHYDHLGVGAPVDGDSIYNGAYDNASGVALLLDVAQAFAHMDPAPRRSILFIATTAEEAGLLGASYYVAHPLRPLTATVAEINVDGANLWGETDDVVGMGADRSSLGATLDSAAARMGLEVRPDRAPEKGFFFRSDHFPFALAGVPALYLEHGTHFRDRPDGWGDALLSRYERERYHQPGDEYDPGFDFAGAVQQARLALRVGYAIAQGDTRPRWLPGRRIRGGIAARASKTRR